MSSYYLPAPMYQGWSKHSGHILRGHLVLFLQICDPHKVLNQKPKRSVKYVCFKLFALKQNTLHHKLSDDVTMTMMIDMT